MAISQVLPIWSGIAWNEKESALQRLRIVPQFIIEVCGDFTYNIISSYHYG